MNGIPFTERTPEAGGHDDIASQRGVADWLHFAATPVFAIMALLTVIQGNSGVVSLCSALHSGLPFSGMTVMYVLMSIFHSAPWLKLMFTRRADSCD